MPKYNAFVSAVILAGAARSLPAVSVAAPSRVSAAPVAVSPGLAPAPYPYMDAPPAVYAPNYYLNGPGASAHIEWCLARYQSYNPDTNMYLGYDGNYHRCRGPAS
jgi:hypothetical protein